MKILIVDAHPPSAQYLCQGLCQDGFNVDVVHDGLQGRNLALSRAYSLLVLDLDLPGQSGRAVLQTLLQAGDTPTIVVTANDSLEDQVFCLQNGADDYLVKPVRLPVFLARARLRMRGAAGQEGLRLTLADLVLDLSKSGSSVPAGDWTSLARNSPCCGCCCSARAMWSRAPNWCSRSGACPSMR